MAADETSPFEAIGGEEGVSALVARFYHYMDVLPEAKRIRAMHADDLSPMVDKLTVFLVGWMGGPRRYTERFGSVIIPVAHRPFDIGPEDREAWLLCMDRALCDSPLDEEWRETVMEPLRQMATMCQTRS